MRGATNVAFHAGPYSDHKDLAAGTTAGERTEGSYASALDAKANRPARAIAFGKGPHNCASCRLPNFTPLREASKESIGHVKGCHRLCGVTTNSKQRSEYVRGLFSLPSYPRFRGRPAKSAAVP